MALTILPSFESGIVLDDTSNLHPFIARTGGVDNGVPRTETPDWVELSIDDTTGQSENACAVVQKGEGATEQ